MLLLFDYGTRPCPAASFTRRSGAMLWIRKADLAPYGGKTDRCCCGYGGLTIDPIELRIFAIGKQDYWDTTDKSRVA